ncbi:molecular chaperone TorD family protein [Nonomuraea sp. NPDC049141]|uniref:nitrate reductase molybdenum cofactor assembly chaperone n=1 Tax=Nonomuraea sp. NPDC049141 TaxID=3155500 RepID=UPI0033FDC766
MMDLGEGELRTAHMVASVLPGYPDDRLYDARQLLTGTVAALPAGQVRERLGAFLDHAAVTAQADLAAHYVATFDPKRRCSPYLTYYGTRKRSARARRRPRCDWRPKEGPVSIRRKSGGYG